MKACSAPARHAVWTARRRQTTARTAARNSRREQKPKIQAARERSLARGSFAVFRRRRGGRGRGRIGPDAVLVQEGVDIRVAASEILQLANERSEHRPLHRLKLLF